MANCKNHSKGVQEMKISHKFVSVAALALLLAACAPPPAAAPAAPKAEAPAAEAKPTEAPKEAAGAMTKVTIQLQWVAQSQFAGYFAALDKGFYKEEGLDVTIKEGAVDIVPQQVVASGAADFGVAWLPKVLVSREEGAKLINIAQVFQRSGTLQVSWKDSGLTKVEDWKGKKVGTWGFGNEHELFAAMRKAGINPDDKAAVTIVQQPFDMSLLLNREVDAAQAMIYNEYAQVLEAINPKTGQLYQPEDLNVINYNDVGTAMLQDGIFVTEDWIAKPENQETAVKFLKATFRGWIFCRDNFNECVDIVLKNGSTLGQSHQAWQLNEINALIWPSPAGIGIMDGKLYDQTAQVSADQKVTKAKAGTEAFRIDLAQKALEALKDMDTKGEKFAKIKVELKEKGQ
jgi:NitT/TauT family transport system substrate-binding protein